MSEMERQEPDPGADLIGAPVTEAPVTESGGATLNHAVPRYWMTEASGILRPAVRAYLHDETMTPIQIAMMAAYLRQWIMADGFAGPEVEQLRRDIRGLNNQAAIRRWIRAALAAGIDPL